MPYGTKFLLLVVSLAAGILALAWYFNVLQGLAVFDQKWASLSRLVLGGLGVFKVTDTFLRKKDKRRFLKLFSDPEKGVGRQRSFAALLLIFGLAYPGAVWVIAIASTYFLFVKEEKVLRVWFNLEEYVHYKGHGFPGTKQEAWEHWVDMNTFMVKTLKGVLGVILIILVLLAASGASSIVVLAAIFALQGHQLLDPLVPDDVEDKDIYKLGISIIRALCGLFVAFSLFSADPPKGPALSFLYN